MSEEKKARILREFKKAYPQDLSIAEVSRRTKLSDVTCSMYIRVLEAKGEIAFSRDVGRSKMFKLKKNS